MNSIIEIKNLGKKYNIIHQRGRYIALRDVLMNILKRPFSFLKSKAKQVAGIETKEEFWALKDINLEIKKGEVVGIIGANGAGKSTLLKILSQITPPTTGEIKIHGRVGSLLEVGTGFHPELTGRENIFLNGAILGMTRDEMAKKFDAIVEFAGIEKFLDTPVKYYSSGMYVRLAFSVAAHLEPDILIIDEVLAVGDAEFQKKCLGKMEEVTKEQGRTILFVSHNMGAVQQLCEKTILLNKGKIEKFENTKECIEYYVNNQSINKNIDIGKIINRRGNGKIKLTKFHIENEKGNIVESLKSESSAVFAFSYECEDPASIKDVDIGFSIDKNMNTANITYTSYTKEKINKINKQGCLKFNMKKLNLAPGMYNVGARIIADGIEADWPKDSVGRFEVCLKDIDIKNSFQSNPSSIVVIDGYWSHN